MTSAPLFSFHLYHSGSSIISQRERRVAPGIGNDKREATIMMKLSSQNLIVAWKWATAERDMLALHRHQELKSKEKIMKDTALTHLSPLLNIYTGRINNMKRVWVRVWRHPVGCWARNCRYIPRSFTGIAQLAKGWTTYFFSYIITRTMSFYEGCLWHILICLCQSLLFAFLKSTFYTASRKMIKTVKDTFVIEKTWGSCLGSTLG